MSRIGRKPVVVPQGVTVNIARAEGEISRMERIEADHKRFAEQAAEHSKQIEDCSSVLDAKRASVASARRS